MRKLKGSIKEKEIVLYIDKEGNPKAYKLLAIAPTFSDTQFTVQVIYSRGELGRSKFDTTLYNKDGQLRIKRCWLQPKDRVYMEDTKEVGTVDTILNEDKTVYIHVVTEGLKLHIYTLDEAAKKLSFRED